MRVNENKNNQLVLRVCVLISVLILAQDGLAAEENWQWSGFLSQSAVYTSDNSFFGPTDDKISGAFGETGVIVNGNVLPSLNFAAQVIGRRAGDISDGTPRFDYINLSYRFVEDMDSMQEIRVGKLKAAIGFFNEVREVPFSRPGIFMPQGIYWDRMRNTRSFYNGAQYFYEHRGELNTFSFRAGAGQQKADQEEMDSLMGLPNILTAGSIKTAHISLLNDYDGGRIRSSFTSAQFKTNLFIDADFFQAKGSLEYLMNVLSLEYNEAHWSLTAEYLRGKTTTAFSSSAFVTAIERPEVSYCQFSYRPTEKFEYIARYESQISDRNDPDGTGFIATEFTPLAPVLPLFGVDASPAHTRYSFDKMLGFAWRPSADLMLRAEWHHVIGTDWVAHYLFNKERLTKEWDLFALQLSYRFK